MAQLGALSSRPGTQAAPAALQALVWASDCRRKRCHLLRANCIPKEPSLVPKASTYAASSHLGKPLTGSSWVREGGTVAPNTVGRREPGFESRVCLTPDHALPPPAVGWGSRALPSLSPPDGTWTLPGCPPHTPRTSTWGSWPHPCPDLPPLPCSRLSLSLCEMGQARRSVLPAPAPGSSHPQLQNPDKTSLGL